MKRAVITGVLCLIVAAVYAQPQQGDLPAPQEGMPNGVQPFCFFEALNLVAHDSTQSRIDVPYRIDEQFFVAVKNSNTSLPFPFRRRGEVLIELLDEKGVSKARTINRLEIGARSTDNDNLEKTWHQGITSFVVAPGEYTIVFEIDDLESERHFLDRKRKTTARAFNGAKLEASTPLFVEPAGGSQTLIPVNFGGNAAFGKSASLFMQLHSNTISSKPIRVEYSISALPFFLQDTRVIFSDTIEQVPLLSLSNIVVMKESDTPRYAFAAAKDGAKTVAMLIPLHGETLPLRPLAFRIRITQDGSEVILNQDFRTIWPDMPLSLRDVDFALEALRHITREDERDSLRSGPRDARLAHLEEFWKKKDRTPDTEYNEMMVEYYRRVDYAQRMFSSMRGSDGYKTDRGRIYILHGPPSRTERTLDPSNGYQEIWSYEGKSKRFTFLDQSKSGNYVLVSTQNL